MDVKWSLRRAALHEERCGQHKDEFFANARAIDSILRTIFNKQWTAAAPEEDGEDVASRGRGAKRDALSKPDTT